MHIYNRSSDYFKGEDEEDMQNDLEHPPYRRVPLMAHDRYEEIIGSLNASMKCNRFEYTKEFQYNVPLDLSEYLYEAVREFSSDCAPLGRCGKSYLSTDYDKVPRRSDIL